MKHNLLLMSIVVLSLLTSITACSPESTLTIEEHQILPMRWEGEQLTFKPIEGNGQDILTEHANERVKPAITF